MTKVFEGTQNTLQVDGYGDVKDAQDALVARIIEADETYRYHGLFYTVDPKGRVADPRRNVIGSVRGGRIFDRNQTEIGRVEGNLQVESGAALLALKDVARSRPNSSDGVFIVRPQVVYVSERGGGGGGSSEFSLAGCIGIMIVAGFALMAIMMAAVFVAITSPIWGGVVLFAFVSANSFVKRYVHEVGDSDDPWAKIRGLHAAKRHSVLSGLTYGLLVSLFFVIAGYQSPSNGFYCLGAVAFGLLVIWKYLDRFAVKRAYRYLADEVVQPPAEPNDKSWVSILQRYAGGAAAVASVVLAIAMGIVMSRHPSISTVASNGPFTPQTAPPIAVNSPEPSSTQSDPGSRPDGKVEPQTKPEVAPQSTRTDQVVASSQDEDLTHLSDTELDHMRNEPYARAGLKFRRADLTAYFSKMDWYHPSTSDQNHIWQEMSPEVRNQILRIKAEENRRKGHPKASEKTNAEDRFPGEHFPQTRQRILASSEIDAMTYAQARYAVNEAYARHGITFRKGPIREQFMKMSWYRPIEGRYYEGSHNLLTETEQNNIDRLESRLTDLQRQGLAK